MIEHTIYVCSLEHALKMNEVGTLKSFVEEKEGKGKYVSETLGDALRRFRILVPDRPGRRTCQDMRKYFFQIGEDLKWRLDDNGRAVLKKIGNQWIHVKYYKDDEFFDEDAISYTPKIERLCTESELKKNSRKLRNYLSMLFHKIENRTDECLFLIGNDFVWKFEPTIKYGRKRNSIRSYTHNGVETCYSYTKRSIVAEGEAERIGKTLR